MFWSNPFQLCLLTHRTYQSLDAYDALILQSIQGGVTSIQLRDKTASFDVLLDWAYHLKALLAPYRVPLIINDHLDIAKTVGADGVHLGQDDVSPKDARALLGPDALIGLSVETLAQVHQANAMEGLSYIAASAVFPSQTKKDIRHLWGIEGLKQCCAASKYPVIAIGGIDIQHVADVKACGAAGIAVIGAIHQAPCAMSAAKALSSKMEASS